MNRLPQPGVIIPSSHLDLLRVMARCDGRNTRDRNTLGGILVEPVWSWNRRELWQRLN
jgi:hypothetical protein